MTEPKKMKTTEDHNNYDQKQRRSYICSTVFTGVVIGFLGASVLYSKHFPSWVPLVFSDYPILFFGMFMVICGSLGYIWAIVD